MFVSLISDPSVSGPARSEAGCVYDSHPMVAYAAHNLATRLGVRACDYALVAIRRMRAEGNADGLAIWLALHAYISQEQPAGIKRSALN